MISYFSFPTQIVFGPGAVAEIPKALARMQVKRPLVVTDPGLVKTDAFKKLQAAASDPWHTFSDVHPNPAEADVEAATAAYQAGNCDAVIAFGGGSALDVGKVIRLRIRRPQVKLAAFDFNDDWSGLVPCITVPTTAGTGSEVGRSSVIILNKTKKVFFHPSLLASLVILDPELTTGLPPKLTAATGADALTHCVESATSPVFHPLCDGIAFEGLHLIASSLREAVRSGHDLEARGRMQMAAMMGGIAFQKDLGATHSLAHPLSSLCNLHHGLANALCLPVVMEFNAARKPGVYERVGHALGLTYATDAKTIRYIRDLFTEIGLAPGLRAHGVSEKNLDSLSDQAIEDSCHRTNPVPVTRADLRQLYEQAL